jgi:hypothetical protein
MKNPRRANARGFGDLGCDHLPHTTRRTIRQRVLGPQPRLIGRLTLRFREARHG